ncbi:hypothetical protein D3C73_1092080 [compost metagenome]
MNACAFNMLHNSRDHHGFTVADCIDLNLFAEHITVNQYRMLRVDLHRFNHVVHQFCIVVDNLHCASAQYVGRTNQHRIAEGLCSLYSLAGIGNCLTFWLRNIEAGQQRFEPFAVLSFVNARQAGAKNVHAGSCQRSCKVDGRLAAKLHDNADRILLRDYVHYILEEQRFEIEPVRSVEVRGHGLRVIVDNDGFVAGVLNRPYRMNGRVVEFNPLADTDRTGAENNYFLLIGMSYFVLCLIGRVVVRR